MPTTTTSTTASKTPAPKPPTAAELATQLAAAQTTTIYVDMGDLAEEDAEAMIENDPALKLEFDLVRGLWAVRLATPEEVAEDQALQNAPAAAPASTTSTTTTTSSTSKPTT